MSGPDQPATFANAAHLDAENPWPGLLSYREEHSSYFHGRDAEAEELFRSVEQKALTLLFGYSGSGKSSLLNARLFPRLRAQGFLPIPIRLDFKSSTGLAAQVRAGIESAFAAQLPGTPLPAAGESLWMWLHRRDVRFQRADGTPVTIVVAFDQFEEMFTVGSESAEARFRSEQFLARLADIVENRRPVDLTAAQSQQLDLGRQNFRILISMREEYVAHLDSYSDRMPSVVENRIRLTPMNGLQALQAVTGPGGNLVTPLVARKIVRFVAATRRSTAAADHRGAEEEWEDLANLRVEPPLLSLVCSQLNARRQKRGLKTITEGMLEGSTELESILQDFYNGCLADQPPAVRAFVEDQLLTKAGFRENIAVERAAEMLREKGVDPIALEILVNRRLLHFEERLELRRVELAHDVLAHVVKASGEARRAEEAVEVQRKRALEAVAAGRRVRRRLCYATTLLVLAIVSAIWGFIGQARARQETRKTLQAEAKLKATLVEADFDVGNVHAADDDPDFSLAIAYFARACRLDPAKTKAGSYLCSLLVAGGWISRIGHPLVHDERVRSAAFSPDGKLIVSASMDKTARIWDAATGEAVTPPLRHADAVVSAVFSPDGRRVVTSCSDKTARVWDARTGAPSTPPLQHAGPVVNAFFSTDGTRIVTASADKTARIWDASTGAPVCPPLAHSDAVVHVDFSPDGRRVVTACSDKTARIWDAVTGAEAPKPLLHEDRVRTSFFSPDGTRVVTASADKKARIWDVATGDLLFELEGHEGAVNWAVFNPDGTQVVTAGSDKKGLLWNATTGKVTGKPLRHNGPIFRAAYSADGTRLITTSSDKTARIWDSATGTPLNQPLRHESTVLNARFSADGTRIVTASARQVLRWHASSPAAISLPLRHQDGVFFAAFTLDGRRLMTASNDGTARIWDAATGARTGADLRHTGTFGGAVFCADGSRILTALPGNKAQIHDAMSGAAIGRALDWTITNSMGATAQPNTRAVLGMRCAALTHDAARIVTVSSEKTAQAWNGADGSPLGQPMEHQDSIYSVAFNADATRVATASADKTARIWDASTGAAVGQPLQHLKAVNNASFSADGKLIVTASDDETARIWDATTGAPVGEPLRHGERVNWAVLSQDSKCVLTICRDNIVRLWDVATGATMGEGIEHDGIINTAVLSPEAGGRRVLTASSDMTAGVWDRASGEADSLPPRHAEGVTAAAFAPDGRRIVTASADKTARIWDTMPLQGPLPGWFIDFAERIGGRRFCKEGTLVAAAPLESSTAIPDTQDDYVHLARWVLTPGSSRTISPMSSITLADFVTRQLRVADELGGARSLQDAHAVLREALEAVPGDPLVLAALAGVLAEGATNDPVSDRKRSEFYCRHAAAHAASHDAEPGMARPREAEVHYRISLAWQKLARLDMALAAIARAIELNPAQATYASWQATLQRERQP